jgi:hypothetical protein
MLGPIALLAEPPVDTDATVQHAGHDSAFGWQAENVRNDAAQRQLKLRITIEIANAPSLPATRRTRFGRSGWSQDLE